MNDYGSGNGISPSGWIGDVCTWTKQKFSNTSKIVIAIPSYVQHIYNLFSFNKGYYGTVGEYSPVLATKTQMIQRTGVENATRDSSSFEMSWTRSNVVNFFVDSTALNLKRTLIESKGISHVSVWHLGGNDWFSGTSASIWV